MRDYLKSKDFHRHMRSLLAPKFRELGWETQAAGKCSFARGGRACWLQVSQYSNAVMGAKFTINLTEGTGSAGDTRILRRLDETDRAVGQALEEQIIARLPRPDPDPEIEVVGDNGGTSWSSSAISRVQICDNGSSRRRLAALFQQKRS